MDNHLLCLPNLATPLPMLWVKGVRFGMGGESWRESSLPVHPVKVSDYWMGQYPVTQDLWEAVMGAARNNSAFQGKRRPVEKVSWKEINDEFLPALNLLTLNTRPPGTAYRLPTEAEWEYAARGGELAARQDFTYSGGQRLDELGWYDGNSHDETKAVGLKLPNALGLYDMSGNVWEWCGDWYGSDYYQQCLDKGLVSDPQGPEEGSYRVIRGGSWLNYARYCRLTFRFSGWPVRRDNLVGFRLVLSFLPPVQ